MAWIGAIPLVCAQRTAVVVLSALSILFLLCSFVAEAKSATNEVSTSVQESPFLSDSAIGTISASIIGESALVDKETGRCLWEGGTTTLSASLAPFLDGAGIGTKHLKATIMSCIFLLAIVSSFTAWIRRRLNETVNPETCSWPVSVLLLIANWTILRLPEINRSFLVAVIALYLVEAYSCSTRRYLANAVSSPVELEDYIERLRHEPPVVTWKVRCFHYERRKWLSALSYIWALRNYSKMKPEEEDNLLSSVAPPSPWIFTKKVVTHQASGNYTYARCVVRVRCFYHMPISLLTYAVMIVAVVMTRQ